MSMILDDKNFTWVWFVMIWIAMSMILDDVSMIFDERVWF